MKNDNYGQFDYLFQFNNTYFNTDFISSILNCNFPTFHISGYNNGKGVVIGTLHNSRNNNEYSVDIHHKKYPDETSTIITSVPRYYIDPKIELEKKQNESIIRLDHMMNGYFVMENFFASKDSSNILVNTFVYPPETIKYLLDNHVDECKNATLTFEKMQLFGILPTKVIQNEISMDNIDTYYKTEYINELEKMTTEEVTKKI